MLVATKSRIAAYAPGFDCVIFRSRSKLNDCTTLSVVIVIEALSILIRSIQIESDAVGSSGKCEKHVACEMFMLRRLNPIPTLLAKAPEAFPVVRSREMATLFFGLSKVECRSVRYLFMNMEGG